VDRFEPTGSTAPTDAGEGPGRRGHRWRIAFSVALVAFVGLGLVGFFDGRQGVAEVEAEGYRLAVDHPERSRLGLPTRWAVEVETVDGSPLPSTITLATTSTYFGLFDENGFDPQPTSASDDGELWYVTFDTVPGSDAFSASFDGRIQPSWQWGQAATTWLIVDGERVAGVRYDTRLWL
jgi:hypothetical protein